MIQKNNTRGKMNNMEITPFGVVSRPNLSLLNNVSLQIIDQIPPKTFDDTKEQATLAVVNNISFNTLKKGGAKKTNINKIEQFEVMLNSMKIVRGGKTKNNKTTNK
jgi:hypothetical protein